MTEPARGVVELGIHEPLPFAGLVFLVAQDSLYSQILVISTYHAYLLQVESLRLLALLLDGGSLLHEPHSDVRYLVVSDLDLIV